MILPPNFIARTKPLLGDDFEPFCQALEAEKPISIRLNRWKSDHRPAYESVPWCRDGYYLPTRPLFTLDPLLHAGLYYVQEASSMFLEQVLTQHITEPVRMLDLCAAPGGKSTHLSSLLPENSLLVSNEYVRSRAYILAENLQKWGNPNTLVCNNTPEDLGRLASFFDAMLVDAPCSGEGMFRKDAGAIEEWSVQNVQTCVQRQKELLQAVWPALKQDGILIYSTCTYNRDEDEEQVKWICEELGAELLTVQMDEACGITATDCGYRFYPHKTKGEGFFISVLRKTATERVSRVKPEKQNTKLTKEQLAVKKYCLHPDDYQCVELQEAIALLPNRHAEAMLFLNKNLRVLYAGIKAGVWKGKSFLPDVALALSTELNKNECTIAEVDLHTALSFLRTENIVLPDSEHGIVLLTFKGHALGWVKNLGNRCNSMYPNEWRIRMNLPAELEYNEIC
ncbi:MAG: rRNA cytosine-C5-methyltransferase [Paludibacteraceae bacterium]|nr:rRNA cytosine-C5-methyltransferase [Paludibacteraceae bacterium]